jgi:hypothetical protein
MKLGLLGNLVIIFAIAGGLGIVGCGSQQASDDAHKLVGTWITQPPDAKEMLAPGQAPTLVLGGDGRGSYTVYPDPHARLVQWFVKGGKLTMSDVDGSGATTYEYHLTGNDKLTLVMPNGEATFTRYPEKTTDEKTEDN